MGKIHLGGLRAVVYLVSATIAAPSISGCSLLFTSSPPSQPEQLPAAAPLDCTSNVTWPVVDTVVGAYQVFRSGYALSQDERAYRNQPISREADIAFGAAFTALFGGSAVYGYIATSKCRKAKALQLERLRREEREELQTR